MKFHPSILFLIGVMNFSLCFAQQDTSLHMFTFLKTDFDSNYIFTPKQRWQVSLYLSSRGYSFAENSGNNNSNAVSFNPTSKLILGGGVSYKSFSMSYGFKVSSNENDSTPGTRGFGFVTSLYAWQHVFDISFQTTKGYIASHTDAFNNTHQQVYRSDIANINLFINYLYNFNYKHFSFNAAFSGSQVQKKSAGAPALGFFFNYFDVHADAPIIPPSFIDSSNSKYNFSEANLVSAGIIAGYAFTVVLPLHTYLTLSLVPGLAFNLGEAKTDVYYTVANPVTVSYKLITKDAFGYDNGKRWFSYIAFFSDKTWIDLNVQGKNESVKNNLGTVDFLIGYRFD